MGGRTVSKDPTSKGTTISETNKIEPENGSDAPNNMSTTKAEDTNDRNCNCSCDIKLQALEIEIEDLKLWKEKKQKFYESISNWKEQVENWMELTFGFTTNSGCSRDEDNMQPSPSTSKNKLNNSHSRKPVMKDSQLILLEGSKNDDFISESEEVDIDNIHCEENRDITAGLINTDETENVEIVPEIFGHFLLNNDNDSLHSSENDGLDFMEEDEDDAEDEPPVQKKKRKKYEEDSDSDDCYTLSSSSSSDYSSDDEDFSLKPTNRKGRPRLSEVKLQPNKLSQTQTSSTNKVPRAILDMDSKKKAELLKHCRKLKENIWECTICGFMLTSIENMLLHIKYNHSSSTHTCPFCRVVIFCRSPKDALLHQAQCKSRPCVTALTKIDQVAKNIVKTKKYNDTVVKEFVEITSSSYNSNHSNKFKKSKTGPPAVVVLSSDDED